MNYGEMEKAAVLSVLDTRETGLTGEQVKKRREMWGENKLKEGKKVSLPVRVLRQLRDPMVLVLLFAAVVSGALSGEEGKGDFFVILAVVVLNTVLGVLQESRAEAALQALKEMTPGSCHVMREGKLCRMEARELVKGDLVHLEAGDVVPADGRVLQSLSLAVTEAALTGEAHAVDKGEEALRGDLPLAEQSGMLFMSSQVVRGRGVMAVTATGMESEMGKIAASIGDEEEKTPLQKKLAKLSGLLTLLVLGICGAMFVLTMVRAGEWSGRGALDAFLLSVSLAVAAIPEGMVAVVTVVLSMGVSRMAKRNAIVRRLTAVETLGCTGVICTDKTGTLTANKMRVVQTYGPLLPLSEAMLLCSDADLEAGTGDPTELALAAAAIQNGVRATKVRARNRRVGELPFDSARKCMSTFHLTKEGATLQFTKGAPDVLFGRCRAILTESGRVKRLDAQTRARLEEINREMARGALRVLAVGMRVHAGEKRRFDEGDERDLTFIGMMGMEDPIREEVPNAIRACAGAGIRVVMITGDHPRTAAAIAEKLGLMQDGKGLLEGKELDAMDDAALGEAVEGCTVFARVKPEHKTRIVDAWRARGVVTAMTGDGVNDAPALRHSDIGIGMGLSGTDVTKGCADLVLADDNFATIVCAVEEGRRIYDNICKAITFLLSSNLSEVLVVFGATMVGVTVLEPIHLLFINLITDSLPALALGMEKAEPSGMHRPPRPASAGIFDHGAVFDIAWQGLLTAVLTASAFLIGGMLEAGGGKSVSEVLRDGSAIGRTMAFLTLALGETFHSLNMRSKTESIFRMEPNPLLRGAVACSVLLTALLLFCPPLTALFGLEQIPLSAYLISLLLSGMMLPAVEVSKLWKRAKRKR